MQDVLLVGIKMPRDHDWEIEDYLNELDMLSQNLEFNAKFRLVQKREKPDRATFVGRGMVERIHNLVMNESLKAVIFDEELSPSQQRHLEKQIPVPVYDRTWIILSIFSERAKTREAVAQVELARLKYEYPRLKRMWSHLHRQAGGTGIRGGEGEKQLEIDRRIARRRMQKLEKTLTRFEVSRHTRKVRRSKHLINVAVVGYTNAGKSTLMNQLTKANVAADDRLFVTLDATSRLWDLDSVLKLVLTDTVGFIRKLPHDLVASFKSTLTEVREASLLFHVIDGSHPHMDKLKQAVEGVIESLLSESIPTVLVFNKIDKLTPLALKSLQREYPEALFISALKRTGFEELREYVLHRFQDRLKQCTLFLPYRHLRQFHHIGEYGQILSSDHVEEGIQVEVRGFTERIQALLRNVPELEPVAELETIGETK